jgi:thiopeptide-type bacteriocin biosynthesis protein
MPAHRVDHPPCDDWPTGHHTGAAKQGKANPGAAVQDTERAALAVLAGVPLTTAAARIGMTAIDLADAVALYKAAGRAALETQAASDGWYQVHVKFADWSQAENSMTAHLWPELCAAELDKIVSSWWYIRKAPCWRLRFHVGAAGPTSMKQFIAGVLQDLTMRNLVTRWWPSIYEPETCVFGGTAGIETAHRLFHADSSSILGYLSQSAPNRPADPIIGRRELSILLCSALLRAANQDWHEQGDVWHRVTRMRPLPPDAPSGRLHSMKSQVHQLISLDTSLAVLVNTNGPLAFARQWLAAFSQAGHAIGAAAHEGTLHRGVRDVLAHHVIFHWNRLGLAVRTQGVLAHTAFETILNPHGQPDARQGTAIDVAEA